MQKELEPIKMENSVPLQRKTSWIARQKDRERERERERKREWRIKWNRICKIKWKLGFNTDIQGHDKNGNHYIPWGSV